MSIVESSIWSYLYLMFQTDIYYTDCADNYGLQYADLSLGRIHTVTVVADELHVGRTSK